MMLTDRLGRMEQQERFVLRDDGIYEEDGATIPRWTIDTS